MKNNKGIGKFELLTMLVIGMVVFCLVMWYFLGVANKEKYTTMRKDALNLKNTVLTNANSFTDDRVIYLGQVVTSGFVSAIKSPFTGKDCSFAESKVETENGISKTTLRCDNYLIDAYRINTDYDNVPIYKVSDWTEKKLSGKNVEEKILYNCLDGGKEKYDEYVEGQYLVSLVNNDYGSNHYNVNTIQNECIVVNKTFYRTKKLIK